MPMRDSQAGSGSGSDSSGTSHSSGCKEAQGTAGRLARRVLHKLQATPLDQPLAVADHRKASDALVSLRDAVLSGESIDGGSIMCLTCAGVATQRRLALSAEVPEALEQLRVTMALITVLIVMAQPETCTPTGHGDAADAADSGSGLDTDSPEHMLAIWGMSSTSSHTVSFSALATLFSIAWLFFMPLSESLICRTARWN